MVAHNVERLDLAVPSLKTGSKKADETISTALPSAVDVVVVGAGNAAFCAALSAAEHGVSVLMLEWVLEEEAGGNSRFTAGAFRCARDPAAVARDVRLAYYGREEVRDLFGVALRADGEVDARRRRSACAPARHPGWSDASQG